MDEWMLQNLVCPRDNGSLEYRNALLLCGDGHEYSVIDGIPVMIFEDDHPTHGYLQKSLEQVKRVRNGEDLSTVLRPVSSEDDIDGFVKGELPYTNGNLYFSIQTRLTRYPLPELRLPKSDGDHLLDVGCNWGRWTTRAAQKGYKAIGLDPSLDAVMAARRVSRQLGVNPQFVVGDARYLPFKDSAFDVVYSYGVLQHFSKENARASLAEMNRVLKVSGRVLVQMANKLGLRSFQQQWRRGFTEGEGFEVRYWKPADLIKTFNDLFGKPKMSADCYFGLGVQGADADLMPLRYKMVVYASETLRQISNRFQPLVNVADSVFLESIKGNGHSITHK
jgi:SAM-dependent methyltransferase/uncharacterized protein YbaR (Trm112 family)